MPPVPVPVKVVRQMVHQTCFALSRVGMVHLHRAHASMRITNHMMV